MPAETSATPPTKNNSADLSGPTIGDVQFVPTTMRRIVPVTALSTPEGLQAGSAYLTRTTDTSETAYLTIPVTNSGAAYHCFVRVDPLQYLSASGAVLNDPTDYDYLSGSVGVVSGGIYTDSCLAPGETGYFIDIQISSSPLFSEVASVQITFSPPPSTGAAPGGHLVPQRYDIGSCSGTRSVRVTGLNDGTAPVSVASSALAPMIYLDESGLPAGWGYLERGRDETVQSGGSTNFFANLYFDLAVARAHFFLDFDSPTAALALEASADGNGEARDLQRIRNRRLTLIGRWRATARRSSNAAQAPLVTRANNLRALRLDPVGSSE